MSILRRPSRSVSQPMASAPIIMPTSPAVATAVPWAVVIPSSPFSSMEGSTAPSTTASKPSSSTAVQHSGATHARERRIGRAPAAGAVPDGVPMVVNPSSGPV